MKRPEPDFAMNDLVAELALIFEREGEGGDGLMRTKELCAVTGWSRDRVLDALHFLDKDGRLVAGRKRIRRLGGDMISVPAYRLRTMCPSGAMGTNGRS